MEDVKNKRIYKVYKHTLPMSVSGKENDMVYIGITSQENPWDRWGVHKAHYEYNEHFSRAISKYAWENFLHEVLFDGLTKEEAEQKEIELIAYYKSTNDKFGYNKANGGSSIGKHTEETKNILSKKTKKRFENPENNPMYGKHHTKESKKKISEKAIGRRHSEEAKQKMSKQRTGEKNVMYGQTHTQEAREKIAKALGHPVRCIETGITYSSEIEAKRQTGVDNTMIHRYLHGRAAYAGKLPNGTKLHWEYVNE